MNPSQCKVHTNSHHFQDETVILMTSFKEQKKSLLKMVNSKDSIKGPFIWKKSEMQVKNLFLLELIVITRIIEISAENKVPVMLKHGKN